MNSIDTPEIRHRAAGPVIAAAEIVRKLEMLASRLPWPRSLPQAKTHAILLASLLWLAAAVVGFSGHDDRGIVGRLKGADFVHFFTLGHVAAIGDVATMYDMRRLHEAQLTLVPESTTEYYPTVYPPQAAVLFMPFDGWRYRTALLVWSFFTIALYAVIVWNAYRRVSEHLPDRTLIIAAAAAFPPFWSLVIYGQITIVILAAFWLGWVALERGRAYAAGAAFGLLALKPQFGIPLAVVVLACGEWRMLAGAVASVAAQALAIWFALGSAVFAGFASSLPMTMRHADMLEEKPFASHSLRAVTRLFPNWFGMPLWLGLSAVVLWYTVRVWKSRAPLRVRLGVVMLASVLVNPHVIIYDVALLALPLVWFAAYMLEAERRARAPVFGVMVYWLFAALFVPTAAAIGLQASVPLMVALLVFVARHSEGVSLSPRVPRSSWN